MSGRAWPRCCGGCGGPAAPTGAPSLAVIFECETTSEANVRDGFWRAAKRKAAAHKATEEALRAGYAHGQNIPARGPWYVRLTRLSTSKLDDDNLARSLKAVRDRVAQEIGVDDGADAIAFRPAQEKLGKAEIAACGFRKGVRVEVWGGEGAPS